MQCVRSLATVLAVLLTACGDGLPDALSGPYVRPPHGHTDSATYQTVMTSAGVAESIRVTYTNHQETPVYFARCHPGDTAPMYDVVRAGPDSLVPLDFASVWSCVGGASTGTLAPEDSVTLTIDLSAHQPSGDTLPVEHWTGSMQSLFTLCWRYRSDSEQCESLDQESMESNVFTLLPPAAGTATP